MAERLRVLIVEDSEDDAELETMALREAGFEVSHERVETVEALQRCLKDTSWDVVLADYSLPALSGRKALEVVRAQGIDIPFIVVSGSIGEEVAVEMMKAGAHDFFSKGQLRRLAAAVKREVDEARVRRARAHEKAKSSQEIERLLGELREAIRARDTFMILAAHELRTPLASAQLKLDRLRRMAKRDPATLTGEELDGSLAFIGKQHWRLATLVDNLTEVSEITSGRRTLVRERVDLDEEVRHTLTLIEEELKASGSDLVVRSGSPAVGHWDRIRIRIILRNLLSNAVKYGGGRPIEIETGMTPDRSAARVSVVDHGVGISVEDQERVFNKFEHIAPSHHHSGFGLGLWIVRLAVEAHGGTIQMQSESGRGSTFLVQLPIRGV